MCIGKPQALIGKGIDIRSGRYRCNSGALGVLATYISQTNIIGEDDNDIRLFNRVHAAD